MGIMKGFAHWSVRSGQILVNICLLNQGQHGFGNTSMSNSPFHHVHLCINNFQIVFSCKSFAKMLQKYCGQISPFFFEQIISLEMKKILFGRLFSLAWSVIIRLKSDLVVLCLKTTTESILTFSSRSETDKFSFLKLKPKFESLAS